MLEARLVRLPSVAALAPPIAMLLLPSLVNELALALAPNAVLLLAKPLASAPRPTEVLLGLLNPEALLTWQGRFIKLCDVPDAHCAKAGETPNTPGAAASAATKARPRSFPRRHARRPDGDPIPSPADANFARAA